MRKLILCGILVLGLAANSWAFLDAIASTAQAIQTKLYQEFMMAKVVEEIKSLRDNYAASMRYYEYFKQMNQGKGIIGNFVQDIVNIGDQTVQEAKQQFNNDWVRDQGYHSDVEKAFQAADEYASNKVKYAGQVFISSVQAQKEGQKLAAAASTMDQSSPQRAILEGQAWTVQLQAQTNANLAELIDLNTRLYELEMEHKKEEMREWSIFTKSAQLVGQRAGEEVTSAGKKLSQ
jgi:hypothetical protein